MPLAEVCAFETNVMPSPVSDDDDGAGNVEGNGAAVEHVHRVLNAAEVGALLARVALIEAGACTGVAWRHTHMAMPPWRKTMYDALVSRDAQLVAGCAVAGSIFLALGNLASDVALVAIDPRLRDQS